MSARPPAVLAVDVGSTSTKAALVGLDGSILASARSTYPLRTADTLGRAEQDPEAWWGALLDVGRELANGRAGEIVAIAVDGHGPTLTAVDADGRPTRPAITWLDARASRELEELGAATGLRGWALGVLPAALWVERHEPDVARATRWYLNTWEFITLRLTGHAAMTLVPGQRLPADAALAALGLAAAKIAHPVAPGEVVGGLVSASASALGLPPGIPVVGGVVDAFASFHGAGLLAPGDAIDTGGGSGGFGVYWHEPVQAAGSFCTPAPLPGLHVVGGAMAATGRALDWFRDDVLGGAVSTERLLAEAADAPPGAGGLLFLPYLAGERSPIWDPRARGAFAGLTLSHGRGHLVRAIIEAAALAIRHVAEPILAAGVTVGEMRVCGGPARDAAWNQIKADVTGFRVAVPHALETAVVGSGILGALGIGAHADLPTAIRAMTRIDRRIEPRPELRDTYETLFEAYVALHPAIAPIVEPLEERLATDRVPA
ncbi:MAG TPA: FGGY-family carbohydrate kinase [Candidatus Limnocylindrales bacterium]|jgi:xylulokinase|nr:FGGY-family carbohydrate kinase [Candidatus Limnocylindrales bacterium]